MKKCHAAGQAGRFPDRDATLAAVGVAGDRARLIAANATVNDCELVVADLGRGNDVVLPEAAIMNSFENDR